MMHKIILAGTSFDVPPPPFGKLRKTMASFNRIRIQGGIESDAGMNEIPVALGFLIDKTPAEIDAMQISFKEMIDALALVPEICGLVESEAKPGEPQVTGTDSIPSTVT